MNYDDMTTRIGGLAKSGASGSRRLKWNLTRTVPDAIHQDAVARDEKMKQEYEHYRRMPATEHERIIGEIESEERARRWLSASVSRWMLEPKVHELDRLYRDFLAHARRDTALSFPDGGTNRLDPSGMLLFHLLTETLRPSIEKHQSAELLRRYTRAMDARDARGRIEAELIEQRIERGQGLATRDEDLPIVKRLTDYVEGVQELRAPMSVADMDNIQETLSFSRSMIALADAAGIRPVDGSHPANAAAKRAYESEAEEYASGRGCDRGGMTMAVSPARLSACEFFAKFIRVADGGQLVRWSIMRHKWSRSMRGTSSIR